MVWREEDHPRDEGGRFTDGGKYYPTNSLEPYKRSNKQNETSKSHTVFTDKKSVETFFKDKSASHSQWDSNLTSYQRYVINDYTIDGYSTINSYLRNYDNGKRYDEKSVIKQIKALDDAIATYYLKSPIIVYRSISSEAFWQYLDNFEELIGVEYSDKAFMSTSPSLDSEALNKDLLMAIRLPAGYGIGAYINDYNGAEEIEFLLARNSKFIITSAKREGKKYFLEMELIK